MMQICVLHYHHYQNYYYIAGWDHRPIHIYSRCCTSYSCCIKSYRHW